jgi:hypothetical protein
MMLKHVIRHSTHGSYYGCCIDGEPKFYKKHARLFDIFQAEMIAKQLRQLDYSVEVIPVPKGIREL